MRIRTGEELRQLRRKAGLTVKRACELTFTPLTTWERWEINPDLPSHRRPSGMAFAFLELYIELNELKGELNELKGRQSPKE
jgi:transcriptional regulator with XRE-family HTH domain